MSRMTDLISRRAAIDALWKALYEYEDKTEKQFQESDELDASDWIEHRIFVQNMSDIDRQTILNLPTAQPERLTDDDFEAIRIHLNAFKEKLCNQHRWKEAEEYQRIIDRFMTFASAQSEIIRCKDCRFYQPMIDQDDLCMYRLMQVDEDDYCSRAERYEDG